MGRNLEFEDKQALEKATKLFWEKGYEHSSLKELLSTMGILNGSFYNKFDNKKNLFIKSLEYYHYDLMAKMTQLFESPATFKEKIRFLFSYALNRQKRKDCPKGCFLVNSVAGDTIEDHEIRNLVEKCLNEFEAFVAEKIAVAIQKGELSNKIDPAQTASIVNIYMQGLMKLCQLNYQETKFRASTDSFLTSLGI